MKSKRDAWTPEERAQAKATDTKRRRRSRDPYFLKNWEGDEDAEVVEETLKDLVHYTTVHEYHAYKWKYKWHPITSKKYWPAQLKILDRAIEMRRIWNYLKGKYDGNKDVDDSYISSKASRGEWKRLIGVRRVPGPQDMITSISASNSVSNGR